MIQLLIKTDCLYNHRRLCPQESFPKAFHKRQAFAFLLAAGWRVFFTCFKNQKARAFCPLKLLISRANPAHAFL